jgi:hypothetical protein
MEERTRERAFPLAYPVEHDGAPLTEVVLRRAKARDMAAIEKIAGEDKTGQMDQTIGIIAVLSGLPADVVGDLDAEDFTALSEALADFFPRAR